jgi:hypothetical protein
MVAYFLLDWKHVTVSPTQEPPARPLRRSFFAAIFIAGALASPADAAPINSRPADITTLMGRAQTLADADSGRNRRGRREALISPTPSSPRQDGPTRTQYGFPSFDNAVSHLCVGFHGKKSSKGVARYALDG